MYGYSKNLVDGSESDELRLRIYITSIVLCNVGFLSMIYGLYFKACGVGNSAYGLLQDSVAGFKFLAHKKRRTIIYAN